VTITFALVRKCSKLKITIFAEIFIIKGDFGGPVYAYKPDSKDATKIDVATQQVVCTLVGSPNIRPNAQCLDGHVTICSSFIGPNAPETPKPSAPAWVNSIITLPPPTKN
jgi:hypothetical protein